jgi:hypothetical protein
MSNNSSTMIHFLRLRFLAFCIGRMLGEFQGE